VMSSKGRFRLVASLARHSTRARPRELLASMLPERSSPRTLRCDLVIHTRVSEKLKSPKVNRKYVHKTLNCMQACHPSIAGFQP
jgi:hypothetical protein